MKIPTLFIFIFLGLNAVAQSEPNSTVKKPYDCELITSNVLEKLIASWSQNDMKMFESELDYWIRLCGASECSQRLLILDNIMNNKPSEKAIEDYFNNDFQYNFNQRVETSKEIDYGYHYTRYKSYYGYVPLNHPIDTISAEIASNMLNDSTLTPDERLICTLFSEKFGIFDEKLKEKDFKETYIKQHTRKIEKEEAKYAFCNLYIGIYRPLGTRKIFATTPTIGFSLSSPLVYPLVVELGVNFRLSYNDKDFDYYAMDELHTVNSDINISGGITFGYQLLRSDKVILMPKLGIGIETIDTGLSKDNGSAQDEYLNVETMHLSFGITTLVPFYKKNYIGFGITYHYCPYQWDHNLRTKFDNSALSADLSWKF